MSFDLSNLYPESCSQELENRREFVTRWIDYSSKYGLGYMLSNRGVGVIFNDNTQIYANFQQKYDSVKNFSNINKNFSLHSTKRKPS